MRGSHSRSMGFTGCIIGDEMILVYTGNGKGKTSACLGQVIRALGCGLKPAFVQFIKKDGEAGEQSYLKKILGKSFCAGGIGFFLKEEDRPRHREAALKTLEIARTLLRSSDVLIADEILYALGMDLVTRQEIIGLIEESNALGKHLILSGRGFPEDLEKYADCITDLQEVKHPWTAGSAAVRGIDF